MKRIRETYQNSPATLETDFDQQDVIILNLQRACEQAIDIAQITGRVAKLQVADTSANVFEILADADIISREKSERIKGMIGFRNIAVHEYEKLNIDIVRAVVTEHIQALIDLADSCMVFVSEVE